MKYLILSICLLHMFNFLPVLQVKNQDSAEKGEWSFSPRKEWETDQAGKDLLVEIAAVKIDSRGDIFLLNRKPIRVHMFDSRGNHLRSFAKKGEGFFFPGRSEPG